VSAGFSICVVKEDLKFSASHFIAHPGSREALHGHNYQVGVRIDGRLGATGYVLDFGLVKKLTKEIVDKIDGRVIIPANSDCLKLERRGRSMRILHESDEFVLPLSDLCLLPLAHSSAEELARYLWGELCDALRSRGALQDVLAIEVSVAEAPGQLAIYRQGIGAP
jgi:6-pyruvoyl tetrahydropterin synthase/QueD family protein